MGVVYFQQPLECKNEDPQQQRKFAAMYFLLQIFVDLGDGQMQIEHLHLH